MGKRTPAFPSQDELLPKGPNHSVQLSPLTGSMTGPRTPQGEIANGNLNWVDKEKLTRLVSSPFLPRR